MFRTAEQIENEVKEIAETKFDEIEGYVLDVNLKGARGSRSVVITGDTESGINLDELSMLSKQIEIALDETDLFTEKYRLEVTSPGLDWPLTTTRDFRRRQGHRVRLEHTLVDVDESVEGELIEVSEHEITVQTENLGELIVPMKQVVRAKVVLDW